MIRSNDPCASTLVMAQLNKRSKVPKLIDVLHMI